ncbi:MAG: sulfatase-like hydrolase/transferase [Myxococcota bacterium]|jgi:arylsulfatase A-like enzyme|nr:sulfatase-like hydrolase/transferase [Myxococcota bacterium]
MLSRFAIALVLAIVASWQAHCRGEPNALPAVTAPAVASDSSPVVLFSIDTLRADHVSAYGYPRPTTPNLDALAKESVLFEECIAQAPSTLPSHASLFTSLIVSHHGALFSRRHKLSDSATTMAELLSTEGFVTAGFHDGGQMDASFGLGQGFDTYEMVRQPATGSEFWRTVARAKRFLDERTKERFFLFLHTYGVHHPYCAEAEFSDLFIDGYQGPLPRCLTKNLLLAINNEKLPIDTADARHITNMYDAGIRSVDASLGSLLAHLRKLGVYESSLIIVTSDHGEELGERGRYGWHSHALFDEQIKVPWIVKLPDAQLAGTRVASQVRSIDILPTLLEILGAATPSHLEGRSALGLAHGEIEAHGRLAVSERDVTEAVLPAVIRGLLWKYENRSQESRTLLYDLGIDPGETTDVLSSYPQIAGELKAALEVQIKGQQAPLQASAVKEDWPESLTKQLRSLGYLGETLEEK